jgi:hypothetical protein
MQPIQNLTTRVMLDGSVVTTTSTFSYSGRIDCAGADNATFIVFGGGAASGTNGYIAAQIEESDLTTTASFAAVSGLNIAATQWTAATAVTDTTAAAGVPVGYITTSLVGRKRFLRIGLRAHSSATAQVGKVVCILDNRSVADTTTGALFTLGN